MFSIITRVAPAVEIIAWQEQGTICMVSKGPKLAPVVPSKRRLVLGAISSLGKSDDAVRVAFRNLFIFLSKPANLVT